MTKKQTRTWGERQLNRVNLQSSRQVEARITEMNEGFEARITKATKHAASEGYEIGRRAAESDGGNDDPATSVFAAGGQGYTRATGTGEHVPPVSWDENLNTAQMLLASNPLVNRPSKIKRDYIIGQGIAPQAADPTLQTILDAFWEDNDMTRYTSELTKQLCDYGAQCVPLAVRQTDGRVELGYFDPGLIQRVIAHPENSKKMWAVVIKEQRNLDPWAHDTPVQVYRIVRKAEQVVVKASRFEMRHKEGCEWSTKDGESFPIDANVEVCPHCEVRVMRQFPDRVIEAKWHNPNNGDDAEPEDTTGLLTTAEQTPREPWEDIMLDSYGLTDYTGDCFFERKNAETNQTLGRSDFLAVADYADKHDAVLYSMAEKVEVAKFFLGQAKVMGADEDEIATWERKIADWNATMTTGALLTTNESVDISLDAPTLAITDDVGGINAIRTFTLGGLGYPDAWFGGPGGTHLATITEQSNPTLQTLRHDQGLVQAWFLQMLCFVRDQAIIAGKYTPADGADTSIELPMPERSVKDVASLAGALMSVIGAADMAEQRGLISKADAIDLVAKIAAELGVHPNTDELKDATVNDEQGAALGLGDNDAALNVNSYFATHAALGDNANQ